MPPRPKFHTFDDVARWVEDHEADHTRERTEVRHEMTAIVDGAKAHIDRVTNAQNAHLSGIERKIDALGGLSTATVDELRLAREERIKRAAADEEKARIKKEAKDAAEAEEAKKKAERDAFNRRAMILGPFIVAIVTALIAAIWSHQH